MKRNLLDLSGKIDSLTIEILQAITKVAESLNTPFFCRRGNGERYSIKTRVRNSH